jgi:hypothetical protein
VLLVRYADDLVACFQHRADAEAFGADLAARLARFSLQLHPDKTRRIEFGRFAAENRRRRGEGKPETFDFLGFTHSCDQTRRGKFIVLRQTAKERMRRKLKKVKAILQRRMHDPVAEVACYLRRVITGHLNYMACPGMVRRCARSSRASPSIGGGPSSDGATKPGSRGGA